MAKKAELRTMRLGMAKNRSQADGANTDEDDPRTMISWLQSQWLGPRSHVFCQMPTKDPLLERKLPLGCGC